MPDTSEPQTEHVVLSSQYRLVFSNIFTLKISDNELMLSFGATMGGPDGNPYLMQEVTVAMTARSTKILSILLGGAIEKFEQQFGEISIPEEKLKALYESIEHTKPLSTAPTPEESESK